LKGKKMVKAAKKVPVLITTDNSKRGVFFAYINPEDAEKDNIPAHDIQMCLYWSHDVKGVLGLAANGPTSGCRIGPPVAKGIIKGVTFVCDASPEAEKAWRKQPWSKS
jgi:hypothetical protein